MRVSSFSRLSATAISIFAVIYLVTMYHVGESLSKSQAQYKGYQVLISLTTVKFNRTIVEYLQTGDVTLLSRAQKQLALIVKQAQSLHIDELSNQIESHVQETKLDQKTPSIIPGNVSPSYMNLSQDNSNNEKN